MYSALSCEGMYGRILIIRIDFNGKNTRDDGVDEKKIRQVYNEKLCVSPSRRHCHLTPFRNPI